MKRADVELLIGVLGLPLGIAGMGGVMLSQENALSLAYAASASVPLAFVGAGGYALWRRLRNRPRRHFVTRSASREELKQIRDLAAEIVTPEVSPLTLMEAFQRADRRTYVTLNEVHPSKGRILCGYFSIMYLSDSGYRKLVERGESVVNFVAADVTSVAGLARGLYVGGVAAKGFSARGECLSKMSDAISARLSLIRDPSFPILSRPVTSDGIALARNYRFLGLDGQPPRLYGLCRQTKAGLEPWLAD